MIPRRIQISLYIIITLITVFSCQRKTTCTIKKDNKAEIKKLIIIADRLYNENKKDSAFVYYNKVKFICNPVTDSKNYLRTINRMARIQQEAGDFLGSEYIITETDSILKNPKDSKYKWESCLISGINYIHIYDYKSALKNFNEALKLSSDEKQKQIITNHIASLYLNQKKYNEALRAFNSLIIQKRVRKSPKDYANVIDNIGYCYYKTANPKAFLYFKSALKLRSDLNDTLELGKSYFHLAAFYEKQEPALSQKYARLSYNSFTHENRIDDRLKSLKLILKNASNDELKENAILYTRLTDSIYIVRQKAKNHFARIKYDSKKEKEENLQLSAQKTENDLKLERQENKNIILYIIILLSLCFILALYFYMTSRANRQKLEAAYKSETRISKKLHDELANDVYQIMAFVENRNLSVTENKDQLLNNLDGIYSRTVDISKEKYPINVNQNYILTLKEMLMGFDTSDTTILLNGLEIILWEGIEKNTKTTIYRVLQELLVNMNKHSNASLVSINFKKNANKILINYTDNGKGIDINKLVLKNGLHNVESRIRRIKGDIDIYTKPEEGFKVFIKFPIL